MALKDLLKTHRTWEDGVSLTLGVMIGLSPWFYDEPVVPLGKRLPSSYVVFGCRLPHSSSTMRIRPIFAFGTGFSGPSFRSLPCSSFGKIGIEGTSVETTDDPHSGRGRINVTGGPPALASLVALFGPMRHHLSACPDWQFTVDGHKQYYGPDREHTSI
jgi:hypothetical protein